MAHNYIATRTVISGYVATSATMPPNAPDSPSTAALEAAIAGSCQRAANGQYPITKSQPLIPAAACSSYTCNMYKAYVRQCASAESSSVYYCLMYQVKSCSKLPLVNTAGSRHCPQRALLLEAFALSIGPASPQTKVTRRALMRFDVASLSWAQSVAPGTACARCSGKQAAALCTIKWCARQAAQAEAAKLVRSRPLAAWSADAGAACKWFKQSWLQLLAPY